MSTNDFDRPPEWYGPGFDGSFEIFEYLQLLEGCWRRIVACCAGAAIVTALLCLFVIPHWYRAQAIIRPASQESNPTVTAGVAGASGLAGRGSMLGGSIL